MYGLVNKAIEDLITERYGLESWLKVCHVAGYDDNGFIGLKSYPDELTFRLVHAASEVLDANPDSLLEAFGEYWVLYTGTKGYGQLMDMAGKTFPDFVKNLDFLHHRVSNMMPQLAPPFFSTLNETDESLRLMYRSHRKGMLPMLKGLIKGLAVKFEIDCTLEVDSIVETESGTQAVLNISWKPLSS